MTAVALPLFDLEDEDDDQGDELPRAFVVRHFVTCSAANCSDPHVYSHPSFGWCSRCSSRHDPPHIEPIECSRCRDESIAALLEEIPA